MRPEEMMSNIAAPQSNALPATQPGKEGVETGQQHAGKDRGCPRCALSDHFSARQGVEDDNILCFGGRTTGIAIAWDAHKTSSAQSSAVRTGIVGWPRSRNSKRRGRSR